MTCQVYQSRRCRPWKTGSGVQFRVWAPHANQVELVLYQAERQKSHFLERGNGGYFDAEILGLGEGQRYAYRLDTGLPRPDPCSLWQPDGVHQPSALFFPEDFAWSDESWRGVAREDLVFYELHIGAFAPEGTFEAVIPRLTDLKELGVTALELMPVAQFPGDRNWGYDGVHLFAAQNSYGGPRGLQKLVDAAHAGGLAVFLDVVYNHLGPEGNYTGEFGPYQSDRYRTPWGPAINFDGRHSDAVRDFVLDNVWHWIHDFHFDGLRLDAVHSMFDTSPRHILREIKETANAAAAARGATATIVAESLLNDVRMLQPPSAGGYGLDAEWNEDFHHAVVAYLAGERHGKYVDFGSPQQLPEVLEQTFLLTGGYSRFRGRRWGAPVGELPGDQFVIGIQNHDHVGNRARGERLGSLVSPPVLRGMISLMLLAPHLPLLFMGDEYAEQNPFLFFCSFGDEQIVESVRLGRRRDYAFEGQIPDPQAASTFTASRLSWSWPAGSIQAGIRTLYRDLLGVRRAWAVLHDWRNRVSVLYPDPATGPILQLRRGAPDSEALWVQMNVTTKPCAAPIPDAGQRLLFSSAAQPYRAAGEDVFRNENELGPYECRVHGPHSYRPLAS